eukprot:9482537-Alexandrium_andersonii.AAC.1
MHSRMDRQIDTTAGICINNKTCGNVANRAAMLHLFTRAAFAVAIVSDIKIPPQPPYHLEGGLI